MLFPTREYCTDHVVSLEGCTVDRKRRSNDEAFGKLWHEPKIWVIQWSRLRRCNIYSTTETKLPAAMPNAGPEQK